MGSKRGSRTTLETSLATGTLPVTQDGTTHVCWVTIYNICFWPEKKSVLFVRRVLTTLAFCTHSICLRIMGYDGHVTKHGCLLCVHKNGVCHKLELVPLQFGKSAWLVHWHPGHANLNLHLATSYLGWGESASQDDIPTNHPLPKPEGTSTWFGGT